MTITDWPEAERPREKLLRLGASALGDAELLALILRHGVRGQDAVALARDMLAAAGGLRNLLELDRKALRRLPGCGDARYAEFAAVLELGRRYLRAELDLAAPITDSGAACRYLGAELRAYRREVFAALFLDTRHRVIGFEVLFLGTLDSAAVHPREAVRRALELNAGSVIFAHNHPSGSAEPSSADFEITRRLRAALALVDVRVLDHLVVAGPEVVSLADRGAL